MEEDEDTNQEGFVRFRYIVPPVGPFLREEDHSAPQIGCTETLVRWIKYSLSRVFRWIFSI